VGRLRLEQLSRCALLGAGGCVPGVDGHLHQLFTVRRPRPWTAPLQPCWRLWATPRLSRTRRLEPARALSKPPSKHPRRGLSSTSQAGTVRTFGLSLGFGGFGDFGGSGISAGGFAQAGVGGPGFVHQHPWRGVGRQPRSARVTFLNALTLFSWLPSSCGFFLVLEIPPPDLAL